MRLDLGTALTWVIATSRNGGYYDAGLPRIGHRYAGALSHLVVNGISGWALTLRLHRDVVLCNRSAQNSECAGSGMKSEAKLAALPVCSW